MRILEDIRRNGCRVGEGYVRRYVASDDPNIEISLVWENGVLVDGEEIECRSCRNRGVTDEWLFNGDDWYCPECWDPRAYRSRVMAEP